MHARFRSPLTSRFLSTDPVGGDPKLPQSSNRYAYVQGNPLKLVDPDGRTALSLVAVGVAAVVIASVAAVLQSPNAVDRTKTNGQVIGASISASINAIQSILKNASSSESTDAAANTNPYQGPVSEPVTVVDPHGNAIRVEQGQKIGSSADGKWQAVKGPGGRQTGTRIDQGHEGHAPGEGAEPHAHVVRPDGTKVTTQDGKQWLPLKTGDEKEPE